MVCKIKRKRKREERQDERKEEKEKENRANVRKNQEWTNLTISEKRGLQKLRDRVKKGELVIVKTDKSRKLMAMNKQDNLKFGIIAVGNDRKVDRNEARKIEEKINNHTRVWLK